MKYFVFFVGPVIQCESDCAQDISLKYPVDSFLCLHTVSLHIMCTD